MLQGFENYRERKSFIRKIVEITRIRTRCFTLPDAKALNTIEKIWTGDPGSITTLADTSSPTLLSLQAKYRVRGNWELEQEITYLAITLEAYERLVPSTIRSHLKLLEDVKSLRVERFLSCIEKQNQISKTDFFLRCLQRQVLVLHHGSGLKFKPDGRVKCSRGRVSETVSMIYNMYRVGQHKPTQAFIRDFSTTEHITPTPEHALWSKNINGVLVHESGSEICLYVIKGAASDFRENTLLKNLASRFRPDTEVFHACLTTYTGAPLHGSRDTTRKWITKSSLASDTDSLDDFAEWLVSLSKRLGRHEFKEMRNIFPDAAMFEKLRRVRKTHDKYSEMQ
jgi:hypothetical protein